MLMKIVFALAVILIALFAYVGTRPSHFEISRELAIAAPAAKIFPYLNRTELANRWNPWLKMDPQARLEVSGPPEGVGAKTAWNDGKQLGTGSATIVESIPAERVKVKLEYKKPFEMSQDAFYFLKASGNQTIVTWKVEGESNFISRLLCTFRVMDMDKMIGDTFVKGLNDLKTLAEAG